MEKIDKLYRCPVCGEILTDVEYEASFESGGIGYCNCDWTCETRIYHEYEVFEKVKNDG